MQITGNYANGQDVLAAVAPLFGVTPSFNPATGTLTLTGATTIANYQTILRAVTYENTSQAPSTLDRTVTFKVNDGALESAGATRGITVTGVDDAPTVTASAGNTPYTEQAAAVAVDSALVARRRRRWRQPDRRDGRRSSRRSRATRCTSRPRTASAASSPAGVLTLSGTATLAQYEQALRSVGFSNATSDTPGTTRSIQFKITTPIASNTTTKTIAITEVNDPPVVNLDAPGALSYTEQSGFVNLFGPAATVTDVDSATLDSLTVTITAGFDADVRRAAARSGGRRLHRHAERGRDHAHARRRHAGAVHDGAARDPVPQHRRRPRRPQRRHRRTRRSPTAPSRWSPTTGPPRARR